MGFLDKVKDTAKDLGEKAQQGVEAGKEKYEETKLKKKAGELKEQIGALVYDQKTGNGAADADAQIDALVAQLTEVNTEIETHTAE